jgi:His/Glu/Gln/Arg/opine family amino acid ABC transporter permease subunit
MSDTLPLGLGYLPQIIGGVGITLFLATSAMVLGCLMGLVLALVRFFEIRFANAFAIGFIEFFLLTPPLIHIFWAYYVLPVVTGWRIDPITVCALALSLSVAAHMAEVFRSGLQAIPKGQHSACHVLGLSAWDRYTKVIFPQTAQVTLGPSTNVLVTLVKDTSLASIIGLGELLHRGEVIAAAKFNFLEILTLVGLIYAAVNYPLILIARRFEARALKAYA